MLGTAHQMLELLVITSKNAFHFLWTSGLLKKMCYIVGISLKFIAVLHVFNCPEGYRLWLFLITENIVTCRTTLFLCIAVWFRCMIHFDAFWPIMAFFWHNISGDVSFWIARQNVIACSFYFSLYTYRLSSPMLIPAKKLNLFLCWILNSFFNLL